MAAETPEERSARLARVMKRTKEAGMQTTEGERIAPLSAHPGQPSAESENPKPAPEPTEKKAAEDAKPLDEQAFSDDLVAAFLTVRGPEEKLAAVARLTWFQTHSQECPDEQIPRPAEIYEWNEQTEGKSGLTTDFVEQYLTQWGEGMHETDPSSQMSRFTDFQFFYTLAPLVKDWQARVLPVEPFRPVRRGKLANWRKADVEQGRLLLDVPTPMIVADNTPQLMLDLPELQTPSGKPWLMEWFDRLGLQSLRQGRGMAWEFHLAIGAMAHLSVAQRDGQWHVLRLSTAEVIDWLHPNGWNQKARDWKRFPEALNRLNAQLGDVYIPGLGKVDMLRATVRPQKPTEPLVEFVLRIPKVAAHGARFDWLKLCQYRKDSAALYRAYLTACDFMHQSAHQGQPITEMIGKPLLDKDGKIRRGKGGKVLRSETELVANPSTRYVKGLTVGQLTEMIGMDPTNRRHRGQAVSAFNRLDSDGVIDLVKDGKVRRIYGRST